MKRVTTMRAIACALMVLTCVSPRAEAQSAFDGNDWVRWSPDLRLLYGVGWADGRSHGISAGVKAVDPTAPQYPRNDPRLVRLNSKTTVGQMVEGIDNFYTNFRNKTIPVRLAADVDWDEANGVRRWTDDDLMILRRIASPKETSSPPEPSATPRD